MLDSGSAMLFHNPWAGTGSIDRSVCVFTLCIVKYECQALSVSHHATQDYGGEQAKMDLALWMQEDGTGIFGALLFATDVFDAGTIRRMVSNYVVRAVKAHAS